jgi:threonine-phosphate decarboxylase
MAAGEGFSHGGNVFEVARAMGKTPEEIIDFSASINPLGPAPLVRDAVCGSLKRCVHYPDNDATELREALAAYHSLTPGEVLVSNGSTELIHLLPALAGGGKGLIVGPAFSEYGRALCQAGMEVDYLVLSPDSPGPFPVAELRKRLREGVDILFICNPGNPTGALIDREQMGGILDACAEYGTFLALDEAFIDYNEPESGKHLVAGSGCGVVLRSMTKFFAIPGFRVGYALGSVAVIDRLRRLRQPWSVNTPAQAAGTASLADPAYVIRTLAHNETERKFLSDGLRNPGNLKVYPSAANYLLCRILSGPDAHRLRDLLLQKGLLIRTCSDFSGLGDSFFRVAVRTRSDSMRLLEALQALLP